MTITFALSLFANKLLLILLSFSFNPELSIINYLLNIHYPINNFYLIFK